MLGEQRCQPLARAIAPTGNGDALAVAFQFADMGDDRIEDIGAFGLPLGREGAALAHAERHDLRHCRFRPLERGEGNHGPVGQRLLPVLLVEKHRVCCDGMIRRRAEGFALQRLDPRLVMVGDLLEPLGARIVIERIEGDDGVGEIIEQRFEPLMEQRQPMLHALMLAPGRNQLIELVVGARRTEQLDITRAEAAAHIGVERGLAHGQQMK